MGGFAGIEGPYETMNEREFLPIRIAVLTVSDTRQLADDRSGDVLVNRIADAGHVLVDRKIIADERMLISSQLLEWCGRECSRPWPHGGPTLRWRPSRCQAHRRRASVVARILREGAPWRSRHSVRRAACAGATSLRRTRQLRDS